VGEPSALGRQQDGPALLTGEVALAGQSLQHLGCGGEGDVEDPGQHGRRDALAVLFEALDLLQVVLDPSHKESVARRGQFQAG
jgi:hypothetical protein